MAVPRPGTEAAAGLHRNTSLEGRDHVGAHDIGAAVATTGETSAVGVGAGEVEQVNTGKGDQKSRDERQSVNRVGGVEAAKQNKGGAEGGGRESDIVQRVDNVGGELAQSFVEVVHLGQDADGGDNHKDIGGRVGELVVAGEGELESDAERLDGHDGNGADEGADAQVDQGIALAVDGGELVDGDDGVDGDGKGVNEEAGLDGVVQNLVDSRDVFVWGCVQDNNDGADQADGTAELAQGAEDLVEEVGAEDSADNDTEGTEGCNEDSRSESVGRKVADLTDDHC